MCLELTTLEHLSLIVQAKYIRNDKTTLKLQSKLFYDCDEINILLD